MTKRDELEALDRFIAELGRDSYLGPWLAESRGEIARDLACDFEPRAPMPGDARRMGAAIVADAQNESARVRREATEEATRIVDTARKHAAEIRGYARTALARAIDQVS